MTKIIKKIIKTTKQKEKKRIKQKFYKKNENPSQFYLKCRKKKRTIIIKLRIIRFRYSKSLLILRKLTFRTNKLFVHVSRKSLTLRLYYSSIQLKKCVSSC